MPSARPCNARRSAPSAALVFSSTVAKSAGLFDGIPAISSGRSCPIVAMKIEKPSPMFFDLNSAT